MSETTSRSGRNWSKEARRSAPARIANLDVTGSGTDPRERHAVRTRADRRKHWDLSASDADADGKLRRRARQAQTPQSGVDVDDDEDDEVFSPVSRSQTKGLSRVGTGDIDVDDGDSDASYNSFNLGLRKKALFEDVEPSGLLSVNTLDLGRAASASSLKIEDRDKHVKVYRIYRSHYEGDLFHDGNLTAEMTTGTNRKMFQHELSRPLFRWVHVENPTMTFNSFVAVVLDSPWLDSAEKESASNILKVARQNSDRSLRMPPGRQGSYVEPEFYEETVDQTVFHGFRSRRQRTETLQWICIPYFVTGEQEKTVKKWSKNDDAASDLDLPTVPFLNTGYIIDGKYFQCAQLWVMMIGDGLIISCARRAIDDLPGNLVHAKSLPPADPKKRNVGDRAPVIIVSDGGIRTWLLPVDKCRTWPEFAANFAELGVDFFDGWDLMYQDAKLTKRDWPKVIALAEKASIRVVLSRSEDDDDDEDWSDESSSDEEPQSTALSQQLSQSDPAIAGAQSAASKSSQVKGPLILIPSDGPSDSENSDAWHVFTLLATNVSKVDGDEGSSNGSISVEPLQKEHALVVDGKMLREDSDETNTYLISYNRRRGESTAWQQCPTSWPDEVGKYLSSIDTSSSADHSFNLNHSKAHLFKAATMIFTFFYPFDYKHIVTEKFWGAINRIIQSEDVTRTPSRFKAMIHNARHLAAVVEDLKEELFSKRTPAYNQTNVPHEFIQAWLMILMYFVLYTSPDAGHSSTYLKRARILLTQGKMKVIQRLQTVSLRDREAVSPLGVASLLVGQLLSDSRGQPMFPDRHLLASLYWRDIQRLTAEVHANPLTRRYQEKFVSLKSELDTIVGILEDQQRVLVALDDSVKESESRSVIVESLNKLQGREASVIEFCLQSAEETLQNFVEMSRRTADLESWVSPVHSVFLHLSWLANSE